MQSAVLLGGLLFLVSINYLYRRDVLYPGTVFAAVWVFAAAFYAFYPFDIDKIAWTTVTVILGGCASFSLGCVLGNRPVVKGRTSWFNDSPTNPQPRRLLVYYVLLTVPFAAYTLMQLTGVFSISPAFFLAARQKVVEAQTEGQVVFSNPVVNLAPTIAVSVAFILMIDERERWLRRLGLISAIILGVLTTGRVILMLLFCGWLFLAMLKRSKRSIRSTAQPLLLTAVMVLVVITAISLLTKEETQNGGSSVAVRLTATYIGGPIAGLNYAIAHSDVFEGSNYSFAQILGPLSIIGFRFQKPPAFDPFFPIPFPFNVFTAYKDYYIDFGPAGCILAFAVFGFITSVLFNSSIHGNRVAQFFSAYLFYAMMLSPFQNAYNLFGRYAYVSLFAFGYFVVMHRIPRIVLPNVHLQLLSRSPERFTSRPSK